MKITTNQDQPQQRLQDPPPLKPQSVLFGNDSAVATPRPNRQEMSSATQPRIYAEAPAVESTTIPALKSFFNPPQRVNGQLGYPLGPTRSPRLPSEETEPIPSPNDRATVNPQTGRAHYSKVPAHVYQGSASIAAGTRSDFDGAQPVATTSGHADTGRSKLAPASGGHGRADNEPGPPPFVRRDALRRARHSRGQTELPSTSERPGRAANKNNAPPRPLRGQDLPLPPPPSDRELFFYSKFKSIDDANRQLGHLKMDRNPAWLNMGTKEPYFGENKNSTVGPLSNEKIRHS